jgi:heparin binding hemagglutinin HbhA
MTEQTKTRIPTPLYAAAGAGDAAYEQLRKLPAVLTELSDRATATLKAYNEQAAASLKAYNEQAGTKAAELRGKATETDFVALRDSAATAAANFAQVAQERAVAVYNELVARGERVVGTGVVEAADVVNADIETTEQPKAVEAAVEEAKAVEAAVEEAKAVEAAPKPRKRVKPAASAE